nr:hypothetical protein [Pseudopedobacter sp.]
MKKLMLTVVALASLQVFAQNSNIESAAIYLRNGEMEDAKKAIDAAVLHPETKNDPKAWFFYTAVYDTLYVNPLYANIMGNDIEEKFFYACKKCIETDVKKRYESYCKDQAIINSAFRSFNRGVSANQQKDYKTALKFYQMVLEVLPYDKNEDLKKNNLSEKNVYLYMANAAVQGGDKQNGKKYLQKLMDLNYDDHLIYMQMATLYLEESDTTSAMKFIDKGREKYPTEKDLITQELNIYLVQGRQDILINKLNSALDINPDDITLLFVRGSVLDNFANEHLKKYKHERDTATILKRKISTEKIPAKKTAMATSYTNFTKAAELNLKLSKENVVKAETDYKKVTELNPDYIDAFFNLGALNNNRSTEIVEKINDLPNSISQAEYDKKYNVLKLQKDSILKTALGYFSQALAIAEAKGEDTPEKKKEKYAYLRDILYSMQQVYANLGDEKKTMEMKKRKEGYEL